MESKSQDIIKDIIEQIQLGRNTKRLLMKIGQVAVQQKKTLTLKDY